MKRYLLALAVLPTMVSAQQAWNVNVMAWNAPTTCTDGQPITACPVTNYQVERSSTATGTFTLVGTTTALTYTHTANAGQNCYRVIAVAAIGASDPTPAICKTNTQPATPPNPPTNLRFTVAVAALGGLSPVYSVTANNEVGTFYGLLPAGRACMTDYPVKPYRSLAFYRVAFNPRELWVAPPAGVNLAAACA